MNYLGLDVHWKTSTLHMLNDAGQQVKSLTVKGGWSKMIDAVAQLKGQATDGLAICYEASCGCGYLYDRFKGLADRIVVAHPAKLKAIYGSKRKTDKIDAQKLAKMLCLDMVPPVHMPAPAVRAWRKMIEYRQRVLAKRTRCKNQLRAWLKEQGIECPLRGKGLWTARGRQWLTQLQPADEPHAMIRALLLEELTMLNAQIKSATRELDKMGRTHPAVVLLKTIPGVGPRTAECLAAYIDQVQRFGRIKQIGSYFGLVPCEDSSAGVQRLGHITRQGPPTVRKLLVEAAWQGIRRSPTIKAYFERIAGGKKDRRKIALVATAHYLSRVVLAMLRSGEVWREKAEVKQKAA